MQLNATSMLACWNETAVEAVGAPGRLPLLPPRVVPFQAADQTGPHLDTHSQRSLRPRTQTQQEKHMSSLLFYRFYSPFAPHIFSPVCCVTFLLCLLSLTLPLIHPYPSLRFCLVSSLLSPLHQVHHLVLRWAYPSNLH